MNPGIFTDMTNMAYHAETGWVSSSQLKRQLPEMFGPEPTNRKALWFGSAFHTAVLGGPSEPWDVHDYATWDSKAAKDATAKAESEGKIPVLERDVQQINAMADALKSHSEAAELIYGDGGQSEVSVFAEVDGVPAKARFDRIVGSTAIDVKTTAARPSPYDLAKAVISYGYDLSADHYLRVGAAAGMDLDEFVLIFCCKEPPHFVTVCNLDVSFLERGEALRDLALSRWLHPQMVDAYPGESGRLNLSMPRWAEL